MEKELLLAVVDEKVLEIEESSRHTTLILTHIVYMNYTMVEAKDEYLLVIHVYNVSKNQGF